jgi:hypothetical protein
MVDFRKALLKAIGRFGVFTFIVICVGGFVWWIVDQYAGNRVTDFLDRVLWLRVTQQPAAAAVIAGVLFVCLCAFIATRDEWIRKLAEFTREPDIASLKILWKPGESVFVHSYRMPPEDATLNVEFRVCVVNTSKRTTLTGIRVRLQELQPYELPCVPCGLRLMNNTKDPLIERFDLHPQEEQFVSLFVQKAGAASFWFLHTTPGIDWTVPAQQYAMTVVASCGPTRAEQRFEVVKNGLQWEMRTINA